LVYIKSLRFFTTLPFVQNDRELYIAVLFLDELHQKNLTPIPLPTPLVLPCEGRWQRTKPFVHGRARKLTILSAKNFFLFPLFVGEG